MIKSEVMNKFGFTNVDEFDTLLLDLDIDPESDELTDEQVETVKNHVTIFASTLAALPAAQAEDNSQNGNGNGNSNGHHAYPCSVTFRVF
jgi:hypothetical protein